ncbi:TANC1 [Symbiodinium natans]|uniref:TANC1 protein n=1 Tax=Symbiodinium natans TaxID=878477 RepID=A0A812IB72_9DINO|nr:TANC1 [Symbiodinium natans]
MEFFLPDVRQDAVKLRRTYLQLALRYHPDKVNVSRSPQGSAEYREATELFQAIQVAYEELSARLDGRGRRGLPGGPGPRVRSAFAAACELGDVAVMRRLLRLRPALAEQTDELGVSPLMFAASGGSLAACEVLLEAKAALETRNPLGWTALTWAALRARTEASSFLLQRGAAVQDNDLIVLAFTGNHETLSILLKACSEEKVLAVRDQKEKGLLHFALTGLAYMKQTAESHQRCVALAIEARCDPAAEDRRACQCRGGGMEDAVPVLCHFVQCMAEDWASADLDQSSVHVAMVQRLLQLHADPRAVGPPGSAIDVARRNGLAQIHKALLGDSAGSAQPPARRLHVSSWRRWCWCCGS